MQGVIRAVSGVRFWTLAALVVVLVSVLRDYGGAWTGGETRRVAAVERRFREADERLRASLDNAAVLRCLGEAGGRCAFAEGFQRQEGIVLLYRGDSLFWWSDHRVLPPRGLLERSPEAPLVRLANGYYVWRDARHGPIRAVGLLPVRSDFAIENRYLQPRYADYLRVPARARLLPADGAGQPVRDARGEAVFRLDLPQGPPAGAGGWLLPLLAFWAAAMALERGARALRRRGKEVAAWAVLLAGTATGWAVATRTGWPPAWRDALLFQPHWFASPGLADSLGALMAGLAALVLPLRFARSAPPGHGARAALAAGLGLGLLARAEQLVVRRLVLDSSLSFDINQVLEPSAIGLAAHALIGLSLYLVLLVAWRLAPAVRGAPIPGLVAALLAVVPWPGLAMPWPEQAWLALASVSLWTFARYRAPAAAAGRILLTAGVSALLMGLVLQRAGAERERDALRRQAAELAEENDPVMEYLFNDAVRGMRQDPFVRGLFRNPLQGSGVADEQIRTRHLGSYFDRYRIGTYWYAPDGRPLNGAGDPPQPQLDSLIAADGHPTATVGLYHLRGGPRAYYLARVAVPFAPGENGSLYLRLERRPARQNSIYPELLLRDGHRGAEAGYDWAVYRDGRLLDSEGDYAFDLRLPLPWRETAEYEEFTAEGRSWLLHRPRAGDLVVLSRPLRAPTAPLSQSSYLFLFFLLLAACWRVPGLLRERLSPGGAATAGNLRGRIQSLVLTLLVFSFLVVGTVTVWHFSRQYRDYHRGRLLRKMSAVVAEIDYESRTEGGGEALRREHPAWPFDLGVRANLGALGEIHGIDLNLFDTTGVLLASSQPEIFGKGLVARIMEPQAWEALHDRGVSQWLQTERIGKLDYLSAYVPLRTEAGRPAAFLHMPYFAQEQNLRADVGGFLVALVNAYLLLLVGGGLVALLISNSITRPLARVQAAFRRVQLGRRNEPIAWEARDEIGMLVAGYNKMLAELERSAALLARSERESAWREMAKQVAHEIKNPLTPMRLSIQHLQRALDAGDPRAEELSRRVSRTLLEQIDTLSTIATAFSNFAKMPRPEPEEVDLAEVLRGVADLFAAREEDDGQAPELTLDLPPGRFPVWADREQLLRVFNNLLTNAAQAMAEDRPGRIDLLLDRTAGGIRVRVRDNGTGIPEDVRDRVFVPNFTTKGSGMGLGLAMSKNIVESASGRIAFETEEGVGTTFSVWLPPLDPAASGEDPPAPVS